MAERPSEEPGVQSTRLAIRTATNCVAVAPDSRAICMHTDDTIVAISSSPGSGLRGIVRITGPEAWGLMANMLDSPPDLAALLAAAPRCFTGMLSDPPLPVLVLFFAGPKSFTGQDVAELHMPGSLALTQAIVEKLMHAGARQAEPGEFSARAFFNGKMDLTEAEGIAATISAENAQQLRAAASLRQGDLHKWVANLTDKLANTLALLEAGIDFAEEEHVSFITPNHLVQSLDWPRMELYNLLAHATRVDRIDALPTVVLIGEPNVGKSSLINALSGSDRSLVSPIPGTTRDVLTTVLHSTHGDIRLVDVAGEEPTSDELRTKMMQSRANALLDADLIVRIVALPDYATNTELPIPASYPARVIDVHNKVDLLSKQEINDLCNYEMTPGEPRRMLEDWQLVSAKTGYNVPELRSAMVRLVTTKPSTAGQYMALNKRHRMLLQQAKQTLTTALVMAVDAEKKPAVFRPELIAAELRHALDLLGQISGTISPDEVLGRIFSTFCVGK